jgi:hypothetical protein
MTMSNVTPRSKRKIGYNVYYCPEGHGESFIGRVETLAEAWELEGASSLPECLYDTARTAGHCAGLSAPDKTGEDLDRAEWFGSAGDHVAVPVFH